MISINCFLSLRFLYIGLIPHFYSLVEPFLFHFLLGFHRVPRFHKSKLALSFFLVLKVSDPSLKSNRCSAKQGNLEEERGTSLLDLPELALESVLGRLSPSELCRMANVCTYLRDVCEDDYFWEKHMKQKWGKLMGNSACKEWHLHIARQRRSKLTNSPQKKGFFSSYSGSWSFLLTRPKPESRGNITSPDSMKAWYQSLENGKLWFPAQVYNREVRKLIQA